MRPGKIICVIALVLLWASVGLCDSPDKEADSLKSQRAKVITELRRNANSIVACELRMSRYYFAAEKLTPTDPAVVFQLLDSASARKDVATVTEALTKVIGKLPGADPISFRSTIYFAQDANKTRWEIAHPGSTSPNKTVFDGKVWMSDAGGQVTIREKGTLPTDTLDSYRYLPIGLANQTIQLADLKQVGPDLLILNQGNEYRFNRAGHCVSLVAKSKRDEGVGLEVTQHIFQYFFNAEWERFALPTVYIEASYSKGGLAMLIVYFISEARFNHSLPVDAFTVSVSPRRLFVDERKEQVLPVLVESSHPDAIQFAKSPEADANFAAQKKLAEEEASKLKQQRPRLLPALIAAGVALVVVSMLIIVRMRSRKQLPK